MDKQLSARLRILIFPVIGLILAIGIGAENWHLFSNKQAVMYTYLENAVQGRVGHGFKTVAGNNISFAGLEPGDLIMGGYPDCAYGRFSHVGMYIGENQVIESYVDLGITIQPIYHYWDYTQVCLLRVQADSKIKKQAVDYLLRRQGSLFYPVAFKPGERIFNCSKIIWKAYLEQGIDLDPGKDFWIAPDVFYNSSYMSIIREAGR